MKTKQLPLSWWCYEDCHVAGKQSFVGVPAAPPLCGWCGEAIVAGERLCWNGVRDAPAYHSEGDGREKSCSNAAYEGLWARAQRGRAPLKVDPRLFLTGTYDLDFNASEPPFCGWCGGEFLEGQPIRYRELGLLEASRWLEPGYADSHLYHDPDCFDAAVLAMLHPNQEGV